jgi:hypothetical protein
MESRILITGDSKSLRNLAGDFGNLYDDPERLFMSSMVGIAADGCSNLVHFGSPYDEVVDSFDYSYFAGEIKASFTSDYPCKEFFIKLSRKYGVSIRVVYIDFGLPYNSGSYTIVDGRLWVPITYETAYECLYQNFTKEFWTYLKHGTHLKHLKPSESIDQFIDRFFGYVLHQDLEEIRRLHQEIVTSIS